MSRTPRGQDYSGAEAPPPILRTGRCPHPSKRMYADKQDAKRAIKRLRNFGERDRIMPYKCECGTWHLGHKR